MDKLRIAVLMTCHNRRAKTLACLDALLAQEGLDTLTLHLYLVDDGSTDGTGEAVREKVPGVMLLSGNGSLFWGGGMRLAFAEAREKDYEYYLWLNDDTLPFPNALSMLLETGRQVESCSGGDAIVIGAVREPGREIPSYGGWIRKTRWKPLALELVGPEGEPRACHAMNGNCVLIPRIVAQKVGNISACFTHRMGDFDYAFRARKMGFGCWLTPEYVGTCARNPVSGTFRDASLSLKERKGSLHRPTDIAPAGEWLRFTWRHGGMAWPIHWLSTFVRLIFPSLWVLLKSKRPG